MHCLLIAYWLPLMHICSAIMHMGPNQLPSSTSCRPGAWGPTWVRGVENLNFELEGSLEESLFSRCRCCRLHGSSISDNEVESENRESCSHAGESANGKGKLEFRAGGHPGGIFICSISALPPARELDSRKRCGK